MTLYVAVCCDPSVDEEVTLHRTMEAALDHARAFMTTLAEEAQGDDEEEFFEEGAHNRVEFQFEYREDRAFVVTVEEPT